MPDLEELKSRARRAETAGDHRLALDCYGRALERERESTDPEMMDPSLRLRVADLRFRLGEPDGALEAYRRATELYAHQGLVPNAIAVCNKVLGVFPEHVESYRRLAELQLEIGLTADARNSLLSYLEAAAERGRAADAREAAEAFLEVEADQEVAVAAAEILAGEGRTDRALDVLRRTWEERTGLRQPAGRIEAFARELDAAVNLNEWKPVWPPPRKRSGAPVAAGPPPRDAPRSEEESAPPEEEPPPAEAEGAPPEGPPRRHNGARTPEPEPAPADGRGNGDGAGPPVGVASPDVAPRATRAESADPDTESATPDVDGRSPDAGAGTPDAEAELRQGLELVEEMLEVAPDRLNLHRRRVRYARRLGDLRLLERSLVDLGEVLIERGSHRGARFVFEEVRDQLNPGSARAAEGLRRLDRLEASPRERSAREEDRASRAGAIDPAEAHREIAADRRFRRRLRRALSATSRELAWLHAAAESCDGDGGGPVPGASHELMGRYLLMRDRPAEAAEHLQAALDRGPTAGEARAELLYHLGRAWRRAEAPDRALGCFERLAEVDADFGAAWAVVTPEDG